MFEQSNILSTGTRLMNNHDACAFVSLNLLRLGSLGQLIHNSHNNIPIIEIEIEISAIRSTHVFGRCSLLESSISMQKK